MKNLCRGTAKLAGFAMVITGFLMPFGNLNADEDRFDYVNVRTWDTEKDPGSFPETSDPLVAVPWLRQRPSFGICFSGGGTRSASAALGQLRALDTLGWLERARYLTANSGGAWTVVPYTYLPSQYGEKRFLGKYLPPGAINDKSLKPKKDDRRSMASAVYHARIVDLSKPGRLFTFRKGDEAYADLIGKIFLKPFRLHDKKKFFSFHQSALAQILKGNSELKDTDFYLARKNRPFLIVTGTLFTRNSAGLDQRYLFEATPLYAGIRKRFTLEAAEAEDDLPNKRVIGGGYVEAFGYDSYAPQQKRRLLSNGRWQVRLKGKWSRGDRRSNKRYRFTLSDVMGMSSASPLITLAAKGIPDPVFPEFRHWAVDRERIINDKALINEAAELKHGDGADIDNLAILPLLARNIENILVFINTRVRFLPPPTGCDTVPAQTMVDDLISLFRRTQKLKHNVVFANGEKELKNICRKFKAQRNKREPLVYCKRYQVVENIRQAIRPRNYTPSICWVYLDRAEQWIEKIPRTGKLTRKLILRQRPFDTFPHYKTFAEQGVTAIDLDRERVHALSNLAAWTVFKGAKDIADGLKGASLSISKRPDPFE